MSYKKETIKFNCPQGNGELLPCFLAEYGKRAKGKAEKKMEDIEKKLQEMAHGKTRPSSRIDEIEKTVKEWKKDPKTLLQAKAIIAEKIADKSAYDQLPVLINLVLIIIVSCLEFINTDIKCIMAIIVLFAVLIVWAFMRGKSDYYNELQVIVEELSK